MGDLVEKVARAIANANGDNFSDAFANKTRWIAKRGMSGGRFRDCNEPYQSDYSDMATAAIAICQAEAADEIARLREEVKRLREPTPAMIEAGITAAENAVEMTRDSYEAYRTDTPSDSVMPIYRAMIAAADDGGR